jgi:hypothetical protein
MYTGMGAKDGISRAKYCYICILEWEPKMGFQKPNIATYVYWNGSQRWDFKSQILLHMYTGMGAKDGISRAKYCYMCILEWEPKMGFQEPNIATCILEWEPKMGFQEPNIATCILEWEPKMGFQEPNIATCILEWEPKMGFQEPN